MPFNKNHPECRNDEVFITNANGVTYQSIGWRTKRRGRVAYSSDGRRIRNDECPNAFPVFAKKSEIRRRNPKVLAFIEE